MKALLIAMTLMMGLSAEAMDLSRPGDGRGPRWPDRGRQRDTMCVAQNRWGQRFQAIAQNARQASNRALRQCQFSSRRSPCRIIGCYSVR